jgi:hypothetical protein
VSSNLPVFIFKNGKFLPPDVLSTKLTPTLKTHVGKDAENLSGSLSLLGLQQLYQKNLS